MARILIAEDEPGIALTIEDDLTLDGYEVEVASDGEAALRCGRSGNFDLLLLDVMLPFRTGFDVCRELRKAGITTPILMLTARTQESDKILGLDLGADDYLTKPFSPHELRARIRALLRRSSSAAELDQVFAFGDIEVDFARGELRRSGRPLDVSALEFKLLSTFIRNRGRLLSREHLLDQVWGHGLSVTERVVDNQVLSLRKKIESNPAEPRVLISVRGMGYRFDPDSGLSER
jgi:DNA-binding response OmpR family regulator